MVPRVRINFNRNEIRAGHSVSGTLVFQIETARRMSDFQITLALKGVLYTAIPLATGTCQAEKSIYSRTVPVPTHCGHHLAGQVEVPFIYQIPHTCPPSSSFDNIATLQYQFVASIVDTVPAVCIPLAVSRAVEVLPTDQGQSPVAVTRRHKRVNYTANTVLDPAKPYFVQLAYPSSYNVVSYKVTLVADIKASHANSTFSSKTEKPLKDPYVIIRKAFDGSNINVLDVAVPEHIDHSIEIVGLCRKYIMMVYLSMDDKSTVSLPIDVEVSGKSLRGRSCESAVTIKRPLLEPFDETAALSKDVSSEMPQAVLAVHNNASPSIKDRRSLSAHKRDLTQLSMTDLATKALKLRPRSDSSEQSDHTGSSSTKTVTSSDSGSPPGTPRSLFSNASSISQLSTSPQAFFNKFDTGRSKLDTLSENPNVTTPQALTSHQRHMRQLSSMSQSESRPRMSSMYKFAKKLSFGQKTMEFSCCGADEASAKKRSTFMGDTFSLRQRESRRSSRASSQVLKRALTPEEDILGAALQTVDSTSSNHSSPSSVYSSPPLTPTGSAGSRSPTRVLARKLSDSFNTKIARGKRSPSGPLPDERRFSISSYYLGGSDFTFQGISTLDTETDRPSDDYAFAFEQELMSNDSELGFAV